MPIGRYRFQDPAINRVHANPNAGTQHSRDRFGVAGGQYERDPRGAKGEAGYFVNTDEVPFAINVPELGRLSARWRLARRGRCLHWACFSVKIRSGRGATRETETRETSSRRQTNVAAAVAALAQTRTALILSHTWTEIVGVLFLLQRTRLIC